MRNMWGGFYEKSVWGACVVCLKDHNQAMQDEFHSLLFRGISWTVIFGLTREFIWKELKCIGIEDLNNLWR